MRRLGTYIAIALFVWQSACLGAFSSVPPYSLLLAIFDSGGGGAEDGTTPAPLPPGRWLQLQVVGLNGTGLDVELTPGVGAPENIVINAAGTHTFTRLFDSGESYTLMIATFPTPAHTCNFSPLGSQNGAFGTTDPNEVIVVTLNCFRNPSVIAVLPQALPNYGSPITSSEPVRFVFNEAMTTGACSVLGSMGPGIRSLSTTNFANDTIVVTPSTTWTLGARDLMIQACSSANGASQAGPYTAQYNVIDASKARYVRAGAGGTGLSAADPMGSLTLALTQLNAQCPPNPPCTIFVADGAYDVGGSGLQMTNEGVNLYGGYSADFSSRNITNFDTILEFQSACTSLPGTVCATVISGVGVTAATTLQGFLIRGYRTAHTHTVGVRVSNGLLIGGNVIDGGNATALSIGIEHTGAGALTIGATTVVGGLYDHDAAAFTQIFGQTMGFRNAAIGGASIVALNSQFIGGPADNSSTIGLNLAHIGFGPSAGRLVNNNIVAMPSTGGGDSALTLAQAPVAFRVLHNAIIAYSGGATSTALELSFGASPIVANNHFRTGGAGPCIRENPFVGAPSVLEGNNFFGCSELYDPAVGGSETTIVGLNGLGFSGPTPNTNVDPNYVDYLGLNFRYASSPPCALTNGGANYLGDAPQDIENVNRTLPVSSGPYEYDSPPNPACL